MEHEKKNSLENIDSSAPNTAESQSISPESERRLLRKLDFRLGPLFATLYFVCYLDRSNIGNAAIAGMLNQLHLTDSQFSTAVSVFYASYVAFETPLTLLLKKLRPHIMISVLAFSWSLVTLCTAFVRTDRALVAVRVLLGFCEAGFFPCLSLYISMIWRREEQIFADQFKLKGLRTAFLFGAAAISGMFGGLLATGITKISKAGTLEGWSWLFIIEGLISMLITLWSYFGLPDELIEARFLNEEDKAVVKAREIERESYMGSKKFEWEEVWAAFKDPKMYLAMIIQFCQDLILYGFSTFLPSILENGLGFSSLEAQYLGVPVYFLGGALFLTGAVVSDRFRLRGTLLLGMNLVGIVGYIVLLAVRNSWVKYFACYLIAFTLYCGTGLNTIWLNNNMAPHYRRATAVGMQFTIGNTAGVVAGQVYRDPPYLLGNWFSLGFLILAELLILTQIWYLRSQNRQKREILGGAREDKQSKRIGCDALEFEYVY